jgi:hypothetical protein
MALAAAALATCLIAGCTSAGNLAWDPGAGQPAAALPAGLVPPGPGVPVGVYEQGFPRSPGLLGSFRSATGIRPRLGVYYSGWGERFWTSFADAARAGGAVPVVQLQPDGIALATITAGHWDSYLSAYADAVRAYGHPVILSFGHEMNGDWYSWGSGHETPWEFVAAWRHVVTVFRVAGASNVAWLWTVSSASEAGQAGWLGQWWPGQGWADLVGIDGYYYRASDSYASVFGTTFGQIRQFTSAPVVISEVGVGTNPSRGRQISALFAGVRADGIDAVIWFDVAQRGGILHQDWRLEDDPAAVSAFRAAAAAN